jgi:hypothetical protein
MMKRGIPIKLPNFGSSASIGRFFPQQCQVNVDDANQAVVMSAGGTGYAVLPIARRVGFYAGLSVEYRPDFRMEDDSIYVWGRFRRLMAPPELRLLGVESSMVSLATQTPLGNVANVLGQGILTSEIGRGFTVVRQDDGDDFTLGILNPPEKPKRQFASSEGRTVLATDLTEVRAASRDYLGPFEVAKGGAALYFKYRLTGAPLVYSVVTKAIGDQWRQPYEAAQPIAAPPGPTLASGSLMVGGGAQTIHVNPGSYYIVVENRAVAPIAPFGVVLPLGEVIAYATYSVELGERP